MADRGLEKMCIDVTEFQVILRDMIPINDIGMYFDWNVQEYVVKSDVIHQEVNLDDSDISQEFLNIAPTIKLNDGGVFVKKSIDYHGKDMKFEINY